MTHTLSLDFGCLFVKPTKLELLCGGSKCMLSQHKAMCSGESLLQYAGKSLGSYALEVLLWQHVLTCVQELIFTYHCALMQEDCQGHC